MSETDPRDARHDSSPERWVNALMDPRDIAPPYPEEIIRGILASGDAFTENFHRLRFHLDHIAPVRAELTIETTPPGFAPEDIREAWVGIKLPMRGYFDPRQGYSIIAREALEALMSHNIQAYSWWQNYYAEEAAYRAPNVDSEGFPQFLANVSRLVFDLSCGTARLPTTTPLLSEVIPVEDLFNERPQTRLT